MSIRKASPYRLVSPVVSEDCLHADVARMLGLLVLPPAMWTTFPAGSVPLPPRFAAKLSRLGLQRGWPDLLILHGTLFGIELKRHGGALSKTRLVRTRRGSLRQLDGQADVFPRLATAGMTIAVCRSVDEVLATIAAWKIPTRRTAECRH